MKSWPKTLESAREAARKLLRRQDGVTADRPVWHFREPDFAQGGYIGPWPPEDNVPILIHPCDYRISAKAAEALGRDFLEKLNRPPS